MPDEKIQILSQLIKVMEHYTKQLEKAYHERNIEQFEQSKKIILQSQIKIKDVLK